MRRLTIAAAGLFILVSLLAACGSSPQAPQPPQEPAKPAPAQAIPNPTATPPPQIVPPAAKPADTTPKPATPITVTWTDDDFDAYSHALTGATPYGYILNFLDGNKMHVASQVIFVFDVKVCDGKLCFDNVPSLAWTYIYQTAERYVKYDGKVLTIMSAPDNVLKTMFGAGVDKMPVIQSATTVKTKMTVTYVPAPK